MPWYSWLEPGIEQEGAKSTKSYSIGEQLQILNFLKQSHILTEHFLRELH